MFHRVKSICAFLLFFVIFYGCNSEKATQLSDANNDFISSGEEFSHAFKTNDFDRISPLFDKNASFENLTTKETINGQKEISNYLKKVRQAKGATDVKITVESIEFDGPGKAFEKGKGKLYREDQLLEEFLFSSEYNKKAGVWLLKAIKAIEHPPFLSHYENLKELDWLIGRWADEDENVSVMYSYKWDKNKNFLTQHFVMKLLDQDELEGDQIITWDAYEKKIRSWIFDSSGGIGTGIWFEKEDAWQVPITYILSNGGKGFALHIYKKIDDNTYTFSSENRWINGKKYPNIGPFKISRIGRKDNEE